MKLKSRNTPLPASRPLADPRPWSRLAYVRAHALKHGMRAAKLTAVRDCIRALKLERPRLP